MNQFCKDVIDFLLSEYDDAYEFNIEVTQHIYSEPTAELLIKLGKGYTLRVDNISVTYIYQLYRTGAFIKERGQFEWQKELVDMIEGS